MSFEERHFYVNALFNLRDKLAKSKRYRESWAASVVKRFIPLQIRTLRKEREWSQADLAKESLLTQGVISRAEDPDYGNLNINTLIRIASGFDCAFVGRFVPFSELGKWYSTIENAKALCVQSFAEDAGFSGIPDPNSQAMGISSMYHWHSRQTHLVLDYFRKQIPQDFASSSYRENVAWGTVPREVWLEQSQVTQELARETVTSNTAQLRPYLIPDFIRMLKKEPRLATSLNPKTPPAPVTSTVMEYLH